MDLMLTQLTSQYQTADITTAIILTTLAVGLLFASKYFLKGVTTDQLFQEDDTPTTLSTRGVYTNVVIGRQRISPLFGWAGRRFTKEEVVGSVSGGKGVGGGGGGGNITQMAYFEDGWHILCLGPTSTLYAIFEAGKNILPSPISKADTPSGSTVQTDVGSFIICWGDSDQPVVRELTDRMGNIDSAWPFVCFVFWVEKRLGTGPTWPSIEYELSSLDCVTNADIVGTFEPSIADPLLDAFGLNPATVVYQLITGDFPYGAGYNPDLLDLTSLEAFAATALTEGLAMNFIMREGNNEISKWLQSILLDTGTLLVDHPDGRLTLPTIREPVFPLPIVDENYQTQPEVEVEVIPFDDVGQANRVIFSFKDRRLNYRDNTVEFGDDGIAEENRRYRITKLRIQTTTSKKVSRVIANRRSAEALGDLVSIKYQVVRGAALLLPGQVFQDTEGRIVRLLSKRTKPTTPLATLDCMMDTYGLPVLSDTDDDDSSGTTDTAKKDESFTFIELPASISGSDSIAVGVLRARVNTRQAGAFIYGSIDDEASFFVLGNQNPSAASFKLQEAILSTDGPDLVETGPLVIASNQDAGNVVSLVGQESEWQNGRQLCVIEDSAGNVEAFFLRELQLQAETLWAANTSYNITNRAVPTALFANGLRFRVVNVSGLQRSGASEPVWPDFVGGRVLDNEVEWEAENFEYRLVGLIRSRFESTALPFSVNDKVWIIETDRLVLFRSTGLLTPGETLCVRTQPFTSSEQVNIDNVLSVCKTLTGDAVTPAGLQFVVGANGDQIIGAIGDRLVGTIT